MIDSLIQHKFLFPGQQENETIHLVIRQHWFYFFLKIVVWFIFVAILLSFDYFVPKYIPQIAEQPYVGYLTVFHSMYMTLLILGLFIIWALYYLNIQIITNERIVDVSQRGIFSHTVSELSLSKIEDVTSETKGVFGTVFGYGYVYVQTAGTVDRFIFENIPHPEQVEKLILDLYEQIPQRTQHEV